MKIRTTAISVVAASTAPFSIEADSIYEIASNTEGFSTLTTAIDTAGLNDILSYEGTFAVFAPTNDAFEALPAETLHKLLKPQWLFHLQDVLKYHVLGSVVRSVNLTDGLEVETLNKESIVFNVDDDGASITTVSNTTSSILIGEGLVDIEADNGIIHGVDAVLLPNSATKTMVDIASGNGDFSTLVAAVVAAGLVDILSGHGPITVLAPTNEAFSKLPNGTLDSLLLPENKEKLIDILSYHVIAGNAHSSTLNPGQVTTLNGDMIAISTDSGVMVNDANVIAADILAANGIIHVIDEVLIPPENVIDKPKPKSSKSTSSKSNKDRIMAKSGKSSGKSGKKL